MEKLIKMIAELESLEKEYQEVSRVISRKTKGKDHQVWMRAYYYYEQPSRYTKIRNLKRKINQLRQKYWYWK